MAKDLFVEWDIHAKNVIFIAKQTDMNEEELSFQIKQSFMDIYRRGREDSLRDLILERGAG